MKMINMIIKDMDAMSVLSKGFCALRPPYLIKMINVIITDQSQINQELIIDQAQENVFSHWITGRTCD